MSYIPHDYWMICERTGIKFRRSEMVQEFSKGGETGLWVQKSSMDPVQPQEYVTGVEDDPSVYPTFPTVAQSQGEALILNDVLVHTKTVFIGNITGVAVNDPIQVIMDNGAAFVNFIYSIEILNITPLIAADGVVRDANGEIVYATEPNSGYSITLNDPIHATASYDNTVYLPSINNEDWI